MLQPYIYIGYIQRKYIQTHCYRVPKRGAQGIWLVCRIGSRLWRDVCTHRNKLCWSWWLRPRIVGWAQYWTKMNSSKWHWSSWDVESRCRGCWYRIWGCPLWRTITGIGWTTHKRIPRWSSHCIHQDRWTSCSGKGCRGTHYSSRLHTTIFTLWTIRTYVSTIPLWHPVVQLPVITSSNIPGGSITLSIIPSWISHTPNRCKSYHTSFNASTCVSMLENALSILLPFLLLKNHPPLDICTSFSSSFNTRAILMSSSVFYFKSFFLEAASAELLLKNMLIKIQTPVWSWTNGSNLAVVQLNRSHRIWSKICIL